VSKGTRTRTRILEAAVETACLDGFQGLNLQPLATKVGLTKSGLYAHFRSKEALQIATLESAAALFQQSVVAPVKSAPAGLPRLTGVFERWLEWPAGAGLPGHCPFFASVVQFDNAEGAVRERLARLFRDFQQVIEQLVASAVRHGHLRPETQPAQFAHELVALRYAHHWSRDFMRDPATEARTRAAFAALTQRGRAEAAQRP
jgi:AcrR family transcriptional regulator